MPHKVKAAFIGEGELLPAVIEAVLEKEILPPENVLLSGANTLCKTAFAERGVTFYSDEVNAVVKAEIVVACASKKRELGTILAPVTGCTRGRIVVAICEGVDAAYVAERVTKGTEILAVPLRRAEDGTLHATLEFSKNFLPFQVEPCRDIIDSICTLDDFTTP